MEIERQNFQKLVQKEIRSSTQDKVLKLSPQQKKNLERLNQILLPIHVKYVDFVPKNEELLKLLNLSFAFKFDKIRNFIRNHKNKVFEMHKVH